MTKYCAISVPANERSTYWSRVVSDIFFPLDAKTNMPDKFDGIIDNWELGSISLSRFCSSPMFYERQKHHLRGLSEDNLLITFATASDARFIQGGNDLHCRKNGFFIQRGDLPYQFSHAEDNTLWVLKVPTQMLKARVRVLERYTSYTYDSSRGIAALFLDTARTIPARMEQVQAQSHEGLGRCLLDLLYLALEDDARALGSGMSSVRMAHLARIERYIQRNLANHAMTIEDIARANGISVRYLHELFKGEETTAGQWIRTKRLEACMEDLRDPRHGETIAEIAYRWGFGDQAQFSRHFKAHFGRTPREVRNEAHGERPARQ